AAPAAPPPALAWPGGRRLLRRQLGERRADPGRSGVRAARRRGGRLTSDTRTGAAAAGPGTRRLDHAPSLARRGRGHRSDAGVLRAHGVAENALASTATCGRWWGSRFTSRVTRCTSAGAVTTCPRSPSRTARSSRSRLLTHP